MKSSKTIEASINKVIKKSNISFYNTIDSHVRHHTIRISIIWGSDTSLAGNIYEIARFANILHKKADYKIQVKEKYIGTINHMLGHHHRIHL